MTTRDPDHPAVRPRLLLTIRDVCDILALSRTTVFELIMSGELESVMIGERQRRIPVAAVEAYVEGLPKAPAQR